MILEVELKLHGQIVANEEFKAVEQLKFSD